jgi:AcrR family transcriptional regulator
MSTDGRDTRWDAHRVTRRRELVADALRAIRKHGANVGMDDIAAQAGVSKTVLYRHFGDRAGLYAAVVESVHSYIHEGLTNALKLTDAADIGRLATDIADAYLGLVERDPEIYRFVLVRPAAGPAGVIDPAGALPDVIGEHVAQAIAEHLDDRGIDSAIASTWGHGLAGFVRAAADHWMATEPETPRTVVVERITRLFTPAFAGALPLD